MLVKRDATLWRSCHVVRGDHRAGAFDSFDAAAERFDRWPPLVDATELPSRAPCEALLYGDEVMSEGVANSPVARRRDHSMAPTLIQPTMTASQKVSSR